LRTVIAEFRELAEVAALMAIGCEELSELERLPFELKPRFDFGLLQPAAIAWKNKRNTLKYVQFGF